MGHSRRDALRMLGVAGTAALFGGWTTHHRPGHDGGPPDDTTTTTSTTATTQQPSPWTSVFFEGFNGTALDTGVWAYDAAWFNYGDIGGQNLDNAWLPKNVSVRDGALRLEAIKEDFDMWTVNTSVTPRIAHYTSGGIVSHVPLWFPGQRIEYGVATDLNFRPGVWTSAPQAGDDSEMDFEFFHNSGNLHMAQWWDYSPSMQEHREIPVSQIPNPTQLQRYACYRRPDGINIFTINDQEYFRCVNKMSQNGQRIRLQHQVGGRWDGGYRSETGSGGSLDPATHATMQVRWVEVTVPKES